MAHVCRVQGERLRRELLERRSDLLYRQRDSSLTTYWPRAREFFIDNRLIRNHVIIVMVWWTGLAPWNFEFPFEAASSATAPTAPERGRQLISNVFKKLSLEFLRKWTLKIEKSGSDSGAGFWKCTSCRASFAHRGPSFIRNSPPPWGFHRATDIVLL